MKRWAAIVGAFFVGLGAGAAARAQEAVSAEDAVKATFLYRFASFVSWPRDSFASPEAPIQLCVLGSPTFAGLLQRVSKDQSISGRPLRARTVSDAGDARSCHVVYALGADVDETLRNAAGAPVLTVTDLVTPRGGHGIIHFAVVDSRVRFYIDDALAADSKLQVSSRLLSLALSVRKRAP